MKESFEAVKNRIRESRAFTLAEALVATIILLLVSAIVAAGIPAAVRAYDNVVIASNAEVLLSTAMSALRNELGTARDVTVSKDTDGNDQIVYYSELYGSMSRIYLKNNVIMLDKYYHADVEEGEEDGDLIGAAAPEASEYKPKPLVSEKAMGKDLFPTYTSVAQPDDDTGIIEFTGLRVVRKSRFGDRDTRAKRDNTYSVKVLTAKNSRMP